MSNFPNFVPALDFGDEIDWSRHPFKIWMKNEFSKATCVHDCSPRCIDRAAINLKICNPFIVPFKYGFFRAALKKAPDDQDEEEFEELKFDKNGIKLVYISPCGKILFYQEHVRRYLNKVKLDLDIDHFTFSHNFTIKKITIRNAYSHFSDISNGKEDRPISFVNQVDGNSFNFNFSYIEKRRFLDQPSVNLTEFRVSCECEDDCSEVENCPCRMLTKTDNCGMTGYEYKRLLAKHEFGIVECNSDCKCSTKCLNRVVQNGIKCQLQVFATRRKGWGVRALHFIPRGTFVCAYNGQILTDEQANSVVVDHFLAGLDHIEVALETARANNLSKEKQPKSGKPLNLNRKAMFGQENPYVVDGSQYTNVGRLFNHSCSPNMFTQNVFIETQDLQFSHIGFFTTCDVPSFTELTWDYGWNLELDDNEEPLYCNCQSLTCRFRLR